MDHGPFHFDWYVDQHGYTVERRLYHGGEVECIDPRGGPRRYYRPLDDDALWLRFAEVCRSREGVLQFVGEFGLLRDAGNSFDLFTTVAGRLWEIAEHLKAGDRLSAASTFVKRRIDDAFPYPDMQETILWSSNKPEIFELAVFPRQLEDALRHQAAEAITGNRQFRRCRNPGCANWFRLGPRAAGEGGRTYTARREFCSDRCRVAWARQRKREAADHA